jgi:hypothetical protein
MAAPEALAIPRRFGETTRTDRWWLQPLSVFLGFSAFIVYSTWAAFQGLPSNAHPGSYWFNGDGANYLSPFYSPPIFAVQPPAGQPLPPHIWMQPTWWPGLLPFSPGFFIMWIPAGFRFTCYYYRGQYYKAFWLDPVACTVGEARKTYWGERYLPLILQNVHRYFFYLAVLFILILSRDAWDGLWFANADGTKHFGVAIGSLVLIVNVFLLAMYTFGCHSFRHLIGGFLDSKSKAPSCASIYNCASCLNAKHGNWAWYSLFWVGFTDVYIRLCALGIWHDYHLFTL